MIKEREIERILEDYHYIIPVKTRKTITKKILEEVEIERTEVLNLLFSIEERVSNLENYMAKDRVLTTKFNIGIKPIDKLRRNLEKKLRS